MVDERFGGFRGMDVVMLVAAFGIYFCCGGLEGVGYSRGDAH